MDVLEGINHPEIEVLLRDLFEEEDIQSIMAICRLREDIDDRGDMNPGAMMDAMRGAMSPMETRIGGDGIDELLFSDEDQLDIRDRPLYRTHQYALQRFAWSYHPRDSIHYSCEHVQQALKKRFCTQMPEIAVKSLGSLVRLFRAKDTLDDTLLAQLEFVVKIGKTAKHRYDEGSVMLSVPRGVPASSVFTIAEAISMYFISRKLSVALLMNDVGK